MMKGSPVAQTKSLQHRVMVTTINALLCFQIVFLLVRATHSFSLAAITASRPRQCSSFSLPLIFSHRRPLPSPLLVAASSSRSSSENPESTASSVSATTTSTLDEKTTAPQLPYDYEIPEEAVIHIKPNAMKRLRELRAQQKLSDLEPLILRMGVRSGGCSGMSYVMDFTTAQEITEDDTVDEYDNNKVQCVVDAKSMLYLYGLELDYSDQLIGGGFKFYNPNAEESCGCGSSFGV